MRDFPTADGAYVSFPNTTHLEGVVPEACVFGVTVDGFLTLAELRGLLAEAERRFAALPMPLRSRVRTEGSRHA